MLRSNHGLLRLLTAALLLVAGHVCRAQYVTKALDSSGNTTFGWSGATNFVPLAVGDSELSKMRTRGIKANYNVDGTTRHLYVWENTYLPGNSGGTNSFGANEDHIGLVVGNTGWSGMGMMQPGGIDLSFLDDSYVLHFAIKANSGDNASHGFGIGQAKFSIGPTAFAFNGETYRLLGNFTRNGQWYYIDIPWSVVRQCAPDGVVFADSLSGSGNFRGNYFWVMSGDVAGTELHLDNIFLYNDGSGTTYPVGDVTGDGEVDIADINAIINIMLGKSPASGYAGDADVNGSGTTDISDINLVINIMLGK